MGKIMATKDGRWLSAFVMVSIAITLVVGGCYKAAPPASPQPAPTPVPAPAPPTPAPAPTPTAAVKEITVTAKYATFEPSTITVAKGQTVKLTLTSTDMSHTFTVDELGINITAGRGQTVTKEFTAQKAGTFTFYCAVSGHRAAGLRGTLKITDQTEQSIAPTPTPAPASTPALEPTPAPPPAPGGESGGY